MMGIKLLSRLLLIYSTVLIVILFIIAANISATVKHLQDHMRREDEGVDTIYERNKLLSQSWSVSERVLISSNSNMPPHAEYRCMIVHVAFMVEDVPSLVTHVLKSVLIYRRCPLHFHFVVDSFNHYILKKLLETWELPYVEYSLYTIDYIRYNLTLRSTFQSKDVMKLSTLLLPYILPQTIDNIIVLDTNILVVCDIQQLWLLALELNVQNKLFAVSESSSDYFDTKAIIMNLRTMRLSNWDLLWESVVKNLPYVNYVSHDVINSVVTAYPDSMSVLPCVWNVNYQNHFRCSMNVTDYRLLYFDSNSASGSEMYQKYLKDVETAIKEHSSLDLRVVPALCGSKNKHIIREKEHKKLPSLPRGSRKKMCELINKEQQRRFITHLYYYGLKYTPRDYYDTTLVSQLSLDRLEKFRLLLNHWDGPMSLTMYGTDGEAWSLETFLQQESIDRDNVVVHVVYKQGWFYPVNHLRNLALNTVSTRYVFLIDGDFLPSFGLFEHLKKANKALLTGYKKRALVIPAFNGKKGFIYPSSKKDLLHQLVKGSVSRFCIWCTHQTHGPTNYTLWTTADRPYIVEWAFHFEPYIVVDRSVPRYDEKFLGYGWNKVSQITALKAEGYEFVVLPNEFIIHSPHKRTTDREIWMTRNYKYCIDSIWRRFLKKLLTKHGHSCLKENKSLPIILDIEL